jgi:hypothetical protein
LSGTTTSYDDVVNERCLEASLLYGEISNTKADADKTLNHITSENLDILMNFIQTWHT